MEEYRLRGERRGTAEAHLQADIFGNKNLVFLLRKGSRAFMRVYGPGTFSCLLRPMCFPDGRVRRLVRSSVSVYAFVYMAVICVFVGVHESG